LFPVTRRRWIADEVSGNSAALIGTHAEHLSRVLRAKVGQEFDIASGDEVRRGRITRIESDRVEFELAELIPVASPPQITLVLSIFKFDRMEWAIEKCTELGVARIVPVIARRTESHLADAAAKRSERWQRIARQAAEQSRRTSPPEVSQPIKLKDALALAGNTRILLSESEKDLRLKDALQSAATDVILALGPEGGWTDSELDHFRDAGWVSASLGDTVLRAETAAIAAVAVVLAQLQQ
jgi:16S rRNA (uracil1498-N3)-methyltransferase